MRDPFLLVVHGSLPGADKPNLHVPLTNCNTTLCISPLRRRNSSARRNIFDGVQVVFRVRHEYYQTLGASAGLGDWTDVEQHAQSVQNVTIEDVQHFCIARFHVSQSSVVRIIPKKEAAGAVQDMPRHVTLESATMEETSSAVVRAVQSPSHVSVTTPDATAVHLRVSAAVDASKQPALNVLAACMGNGCMIKGHTTAVSNVIWNCQNGRRSARLRRTEAIYTCRPSSLRMQKIN